MAKRKGNLNRLINKAAKTHTKYLKEYEKYGDAPANIKVLNNIKSTVAKSLYVASELADKLKQPAISNALLGVQEVLTPISDELLTSYRKIVADDDHDDDDARESHHEDNVFARYLKEKNPPSLSDLTMRVQWASPDTFDSKLDELVNFVSEEPKDGTGH